jgi:hypothetical protein
MRDNTLEEINQRCRLLLGVHVDEHKTKLITKNILRKYMHMIKNQRNKKKHT